MLKSKEEFYKIVAKQKPSILALVSEVREEFEKFTRDKRKCTIFSLVDDENGNFHICEGIRRVNNIGYYVLEGNYELENGFLDK